MPVQPVDTLTWRTSSYSGGASGNCVEVATLPWRTSSYSGGNSGNCVEVATLRAAVAVRDSKDPHGGILRLSAGSWRALSAAIVP